jgi:hypothetical protein
MLPPLGPEGPTQTPDAVCCSRDDCLGRLHKRATCHQQGRNTGNELPKPRTQCRTGEKQGGTRVSAFFGGDLTPGNIPFFELKRGILDRGHGRCRQSSARSLPARGRDSGSATGPHARDPPEGERVPEGHEDDVRVGDPHKRMDRGARWRPVRPPARRRPMPLDLRDRSGSAEERKSPPGKSRRGKREDAARELEAHASAK